VMFLPIQYRCARPLLWQLDYTALAKTQDEGVDKWMSLPTFDQERRTSSTWKLRLLFGRMPANQGACSLSRSAVLI
jgi:hypothetical protein